MNNRWTGGQYSIFRIVFGIYLLLYLLYLIPSKEMISNASKSSLFIVFDDPLFIIGFITSAAIASIFLLLGCRDRIAALWIWSVLACLFGCNPRIANSALSYTGWILLAHIFITSAPFGSLAARGRTNPAGDWIMHKTIFTAAWIILAVSYGYRGYTKLLNPSWTTGESLNSMLWITLSAELLFAPLALISRLRPLLWSGMLLMQFAFAFLLNLLDFTVAMILFHILTFDPAWIRPKKSTGREILYYDGQCGLCHAVIRFLLAEDQDAIFKFAPLQSKAFEQSLSQDERNKLPDSIVLLTGNGRILTLSSAVIYLLVRLGGLWRIFGEILQLIPRLLRDSSYNFIGSIRHKLFTQPNSTCPLITKHLRTRFLSS